MISTISILTCATKDGARMETNRERDPQPFLKKIMLICYHIFWVYTFIFCELYKILYIDFLFRLDIMNVKQVSL